METTKSETQKSLAKSKLKPSTDSLRVKRETKKRILAELAAMNKKEYGRPISPDQYISMAISLVQPEHLQSLQENSLTAKDRFEQKFKEYCIQKGRVSRDEFLATLLG